MTRARYQHLVVLAAYLGISFAYFGLPVLGDFSGFYIGHRSDSDPASFMWYLAWWPYALQHQLNPFLTRIVWAPTGFNLAWATSVPGASLLAAPLTLTHGVVVAYNVWVLVAPALAAWTAYLLCHHVTKAFWASLIGGYLFGFSTYELKQLSNHMNLFLIFLTPIAVYLVLLRFEERMRSPAFVLLLSAVLALQFSFSTEVFLTTTLFGALGLVLALIIMPEEVRHRLLAAVPWIGAAYVLAGIIVAPYLYYAFALGFPDKPLFVRGEYSADLLAFFIPTDVTIGHRLTATIARRFVSLGEQQAYLGPPLILLLLLFAREQWGRPGAKLLGVLLSLICFAALGPMLHVGGQAIAGLPSGLLLHVPLVNWTLPSRYMMYGFLVIAISVAVSLGATEPPRWAKWMLVFLPLLPLRALTPVPPIGDAIPARIMLYIVDGVAVVIIVWLMLTATALRRSSAGTKWALALLSVLFLLPDLSSGYWRARVDTPAFFTTGMYRKYLSPGENVLVIPYGLNGNSMCWQAQSGMYFRMPGGYVRADTPPEFLRWPIVKTFYSGTLIPRYGTELQAFLRAHDVRTVIVAQPNPPGPWAHSLFSTLGVPPIEAGDVTVYKLR